MSNIPLNIDFQQVLLHLLNFAILFAVIYFLLYKPVKNFMDKRKLEYETMDSQAEDKLKQAQELKDSYEDKLKVADEEIQNRMAQAANDSQQLCADMEAQARQKAQEILSRAKEQAEIERDKIISETQDSVVKIAQDAARKVIFENSSEAFDRFLKETGQE